jgi:hypothetical protein
MTADAEGYTAYSARFATHLGDYLTLATHFPTIRLREFEALVQIAGLKNPKHVLEVPAEGRIIERLLPATNIVRADLLKVMSSEAGTIVPTNWGLEGLKNNYFDAVLSVAPIHHARESEKQAYVQGAWRVLSSNGILAFGEVALGSKVHDFLDGFVNSHTRTGHVGLYVDKDFVQVLEQTGFEETSSELRDCHWIFDSYDSAFFYITNLFDLQEVEKDSLLATLQNQLGLREESGKIVLPWELLYFRGVKP